MESLILYISKLFSFCSISMINTNSVVFVPFCFKFDIFTADQWV